VKDEILQMEKAGVRTLTFNFSRPLPLHFLRRYSKAAHALPVHHTMAKYLLELSLVDYVPLCTFIDIWLWLFHYDKKGVDLAYYTPHIFLLLLDIFLYLDISFT
jgi:hypothetical protein